MIFLKQSTAVTLKIGPFVDSGDGNTDETALTISQADVRLSKNGGDMAQKNESTSCTHDEIGYYDCPLNTTDTNTLGHLKVMVHESGALHVWADCMVMPSNVWDSLFGSDKLQVHVDEMTAGIITATVIATDAIDADAIANSAIDANSIATGAITSAKFAAGAIDADAIADNAIDAGALASNAITSAKIATGAITSSTFAAGAIDAAAIADNAIDAGAIASNALTAAKFATDVGQEFADALLGRNIAGGGDGTRTVGQAMGFLRNRWEISGGTLTVYAADDSTPLWTAAVATAAVDPITSVDPS